MQVSRIAAGRNPLVLVVDDDAAVRSSLKFSLEAEGFDVLDYASAAELLGAPQVSAADCLVTDFNLPDMNGLELLERLRGRHIGIPALMITSQPSRAVRDGAAAAGIRIVEKPLLGNALLDGIRRITG